jgi:hypothetical protein
MAGNCVALIGYVAADSSFLRPCLVVSPQTFDDEILTQGFTPTKVETCSLSKAYIGLEISDDWFRKVFIPDLIARSERFSCRVPDFLIRDNCSAHCGPESDGL